MSYADPNAPEDKDNKPCEKCGQVDVGQTGEYPCEKCGLPTTHDDEVKR